jgi:predicted metal-dependent enzyme (double-stranded beta helix superfamily)
VTIPGDELTRPELLAYVERLAREPEKWSHLVSHQPDHRTYAEVTRAPQLGVWVICWMDDHDTGFHDHDISAGAVAVVEGRLREERLRIGGAPEVAEYGPGQAFDFAAADIHRMSHAGGGPAVSLHAYSPPLWRMGAYAIEPSGVLTRTSISYAEELRPPEAAPSALEAASSTK